MRFEVDDDDLSISLELDDEPEGIDLTADNLGETILRYAASQMHMQAMESKSPDGKAWAPLRPATIQRKGSDTIGIQTGAMLADLDSGSIDVEPRSATWRYPDNETRPRTHGFHNGRPATEPGKPDKQPARPLIGWTDEARRHAHDLITEAQDKI